jgi:outer membrane protein assembly factor BamB
MNKLWAILLSLWLGAFASRAGHSGWQEAGPQALGASGEAQIAETDGASWDCTNGQHAIWHVHVGGYNGSPVVHQGNVLLGTNYAEPHNPRIRGKQGLMTCFSKKTGELLWQAVHPRLPERINDMAAAMYARPSVDGDRVFYVSNRGELVCLDLNGFRDGKNDGPFREETWTGLADADVIWKLDLVTKLGVYKRDAGDVCSPLPGTLVVGERVYCATGNGVGPGLDMLPKPDAPSFLAVEKTTGRVAWTSSAPGRDIVYSQWSAPVFAKVDDRPQIIFPGGDGRLYGFEPLTGRLLWKLDLNSADVAPQQQGTTRKTRDFFVAAPVVAAEMLYVGLSHVPEAGTDPHRPLIAVDLRLVEKSPDRAIRWRFTDKDFGGTFGSAAVADGVVYTLGGEGVLFALDDQTGRELWRSYLSREASGHLLSPCVHAGQVFVGDGSTLFAFRAGRSKKCLGRYQLDDLIQGMPAADGDSVYVSTRRTLWALRLPDH